MKDTHELTYPEYCPLCSKVLNVIKPFGLMPIAISCTNRDCKLGQEWMSPELYDDILSENTSLPNKSRLDDILSSEVQDQIFNSTDGLCIYNNFYFDHFLNCGECKLTHLSLNKIKCKRDFDIHIYCPFISNYGRKHFEYYISTKRKELDELESCVNKLINMQKEFKEKTE